MNFRKLQHTIHNSGKDFNVYKILFFGVTAMFWGSNYDFLLTLFEYFIQHNQIFIGILISIIFSNTFKSRIEDRIVFHYKDFVFYTMSIYSLYAIGEYFVKTIPLAIQQINLIGF